jgi:hypothetical protein
MARKSRRIRAPTAPDDLETVRKGVRRVGSILLGFSRLNGINSHSLMFSADRFCPNSTIELKDNTVIVVLGASGDLAKKKTVSIL